jgi:putative membrane protein
MYLGKRFSVGSYLLWMKRELGILFLWALLVTTLNDVLFIYHLSTALLPIQVLEIIGTALAICLGFKNEQCFARNREALLTCQEINSVSIIWAKKLATMPGDSQSSQAMARLKRMYYRHFAWLAAMRFTLRESRIWENLKDPGTAKFMAAFPTPEKQSSLSAELSTYLSESELQQVLAHRGDKPTLILGMQYDEIAEMFRREIIGERVFQNLAAPADDLVRLQDAAKRIKNYPYPRNSYSITQILVWAFCGMVPFALFPYAVELGRVAGIEHWTVWLNVLFSLLIGSVFVTLEKVGEHSSNPFEGNVNDVPITAIARRIEIEMRIMLGEQTDLQPLESKYNILF